MKPRFEEHDNQLFRMLDKPDAINEFSKTPCVIACKYGGLKKYYILDFPLSNPSMSMLAEGFEIIGYPVEEGSKEWAWQMLKQNYILVGAYWGDDVIVSPGGQLDCEVIPIKAFGKRKGIPITEQDFIWHAETNGWQIYAEPKPESENIIHGHVTADMRLKYIDLGRYKVGDWVEYRLDGDTYYGKICDIRGYVYYLSVTTEEIPKDQARAIMLESIIRKLAPSQVVIHIGCLSGTVRPVSTNGIHIWFYLIGIDDKIIATIRISSLDTHTRELVESLLEAMEGDK